MASDARDGDEVATVSAVKDDSAIMDERLAALVSELQGLSLEELQARKEAVATELESLEAERDGLRHIVTTLTDQIEHLTEEMFGEANERVSTAERARFEAQMAQAEAEQRRLLTEDEMRRSRARIDHLKSLIEQAQNRQGEENQTVGTDPAREFFVKIKLSVSARKSPIHPSTPVMQSPKTGHRLVESADNGDNLLPVEPLLWSEFEEFMTKRTSVSKILQTLYFKRCLEEDIYPCLRDVNIVSYADELLDLIATNDLVLESLNAPIEGRCFLSGAASTTLTHRLKSVRSTGGDLEQWRHICTPVYARTVAVAELYTYLRHLARGIVKTTDEEVYTEIVRRRLIIACRRLGWAGKLPFL